MFGVKILLQLLHEYATVQFIKCNVHTNNNMNNEVNSLWEPFHKLNKNRVVKQFYKYKQF